MAMAMAMPIDLPDAANSSDEVLPRAMAWYLEAQRDSDALIQNKIQLLKHYDVEGMTRVAAICHWGRSGSLLLASYLDGHDHLVMMPVNTSESIYQFWEEYRHLSLWEKLITYPAFLVRVHYSDCLFGQGGYSVPEPDYFAAIHALFAAYGSRPQAWLDERRRFFQFLHVATALAAGTRPATPRPWMIASQHFFDESLAASLREDFPEGRFIHTVRDPITSLDSWFDRHCYMQFDEKQLKPDSPYRFPAYDAVNQLLTWDVPHRNADADSRAVRFEDMHLDPAATMRRVAAWLEIPYRDTLLASTYNGVPYVVESGGNTWVGANPANAKRRWKHLSRLDRACAFALFHQNFLDWGYPYPRIFRVAAFRWIAIFALIALPMRIEIINAGLVLRRQALAKWRVGFIVQACMLPFALSLRRARMIYVVSRHAISRNVGRRRLLRLV